MSFFDHLLTKINNSIEYHAEFKWRNALQKQLDDLIAATQAAKLLATTTRTNDDRIMNDAWRHDIVRAVKRCNNLWLERATEDQIGECCIGVTELQKAYFQWCEDSPELQGRLRRYEIYWNSCQSVDKDTGALFHGHYIRPCAYRLATLYVDSGNANKCKEILQWLESSENDLAERGNT